MPVLTLAQSLRCGFPPGAARLELPDPRGGRPGLRLGGPGLGSATQGKRPGLRLGVLGAASSGRWPGPRVSHRPKEGQSPSSTPAARTPGFQSEGCPTEVELL